MIEHIFMLILKNIPAKHPISILKLCRIQLPIKRAKLSDAFSKKGSENTIFLTTTARNYLIEYLPPSRFKSLVALLFFDIDKSGKVYSGAKHLPLNSQVPIPLTIKIEKARFLKDVGYIANSFFYYAVTRRKCSRMAFCRHALFALI